MRKLALSDDILLSVDKPARYIGGELNSRDKNLDDVDIRFVMCFPDVYEIGMSHIGIQILYDMLNSREDTFCERLFSPWVDLDKILREKNIPLFSLESQEAVKDADFLGITLQYEMCYTNILQVLELSQIPIYANDRGEEFPIVMAVHAPITRSLWHLFLIFSILEKVRWYMINCLTFTRNVKRIIFQRMSFY